MNVFASIMVCELVLGDVIALYAWLLAGCLQHQKYITSIAGNYFFENLL